jgi:putative ABC transport system permease protein
LIYVPQKAGEAKKYSEENGLVFAQPNFFKIFDRKIIQGDGFKGLQNPNEAVISVKSAVKYFGREDVIGEVLKFDDREYKITAVMEDYPSNTDFPFNILFSFVTVKAERDKEGWHSIWSDEQCYFLLKPDSKISEIDRRMLDFSKKHMGADTKMVFLTQPLKDIHFDDRFGNYSHNTVSKSMLSILGVIAIFLIITACINFINLSTAEAINRSKEVGIRKSLGSSRHQLIMQFLGESALVTVAAILIALLVAKGALSFLNPFLSVDLSLNFGSDGGLWIYMVVVTLAVTFLSGLYPSLVVSGFNPVLALKNRIGNRNSSGFNLRRGLVVLQFFISQFFIIGTIVLMRQMDYFQNKDLGFKKDAIVTVPLAVGRMPSTDFQTNQMHVLREEVGRINGIEIASLSSTPPSSGNVSGTNFSVEGNPKDFETQIKMIDGNYVGLYGLELVAGKNIGDADTTRGYIVNEKLASIAGYKNPRDIIGVRMKIWGKNYPIVGVVKDFHTVSLHQGIEATAMFNRIKNYRTLSLRISPVHFKEAIAKVQKAWEAAYPENIFSYRFMDDQIKEFYEREQKMSVLLTIFTSMAIFIGCLGLFGLASFMANQRTREIGVRKVLGASVESIMLMFSKEFVILIGISFVIASPFAWYVMNQWLDGFAYKIQMGPVIFISGLIVTLVLAVLTVGYRSFQAAAVNPAQSLKSE